MHRRQDAAALRRRGVAVEVVDEQDAVGEVGEREAGIGGRQRLVHDHRGGGVEPGAAVLLGDGEPEQPELAGAAEEGEVELLLAVVSRRPAARPRRRRTRPPSAPAGGARRWGRRDRGRGKRPDSWVGRYRAPPARATKRSSAGLRAGGRPTGRRSACWALPVATARCARPPARRPAPLGRRDWGLVPPGSPMLAMTRQVIDVVERSAFGVQRWRSWPAGQQARAATQNAERGTARAARLTRAPART